jgi:hypothetical protein
MRETIEKLNRLSDSDVELQHKREWFGYLELAEKNSQNEPEQRQLKDRLIQQFSHTLGSSLVVQQATIKRVIKTQDYDKLLRVLNELNRIKQSLHLLSISARDVHKLKAEIVDSLSKKGTDLKSVFFKSLVSVLETILNDEEYHLVYKRYFHNVGRKSYFDSFSSLPKSEQEKLLTQWKNTQFWFDEEEKKTIDLVTWDTLSSKATQDIFDNWLLEELHQQIEKILQQQSVNELFKLVDSAFFTFHFENCASLSFKSIDSIGASYVAWIFLELALNTFKYAEAGSEAIVKISENEYLYKIHWRNQITEQVVQAPGSRAGLDVLAIMVENLDGELNHLRHENFFEVTIYIPKFKTENNHENSLD